MNYDALEITHKDPHSMQWLAEAASNSEEPTKPSTAETVDRLNAQPWTQSRAKKRVQHQQRQEAAAKGTTVQHESRDAIAEIQDEFLQAAARGDCGKCARMAEAGRGPFAACGITPVQSQKGDESR